MGYSPWGQKELDTTEQLSIVAHPEHIRGIILTRCSYKIYLPWFFSNPDAFD